MKWKIRSNMAFSTVFQPAKVVLGAAMPTVEELLQQTSGTAFVSVPKSAVQGWIIQKPSNPTSSMGIHLYRTFPVLLTPQRSLYY